jgi:nucleoid DNA-binding protein
MINKRALANKLSKRTTLSQKEALIIVEELFGLMVEGLVDGDDISVVGFGKFYLYEHASRPVRNPKTQEPMLLKPYKSLRFKCSDIVKQLLKESSSEE